METAPFDLELSCELTETELLLKAALLSAKLFERAQLEAKKKAAMSDFKSADDELEAVIVKVAREIRTEAEYRDILCVEKPDYHSGMVDTVRLDTETTVSRRSMRPEERQELMPYAGELQHVHGTKSKHKGKTKVTHGFAASELPETRPDVTVGLPASKLDKLSKELGNKMRAAVDSLNESKPDNTNADERDPFKTGLQ